MITAVFCTALGVLALGLRIGVCAIEQALGATRPQDAAVESVQNRHKPGPLWRVTSGRRWTLHTTVLRGCLHSVETAAFTMLGYETAGVPGALLVVAVYAVGGSILEDRARIRSWGGKKAARMGARILQPFVPAGVGERSIETAEADMIGAVLELKKLTVAEYMVPIQDTVLVKLNSSVEEALELLVQHRLSRAPMVDETNAIVVTLKDLLIAERSGTAVEAAAVGRKCMVVPEAKPIDSMLRDMRVGREHLAVVADEYGTMSGIITLEDCIEALVGEIEDEHDAVESLVEKNPDGSFQVKGGAAISEVNELLGSRLVSDSDTTIGGMIFSELGRGAVAGDMVQLGEWSFTIIETHRRRIRSVVARKSGGEQAQLSQVDPRG